MMIYNGFKSQTLLGSVVLNEVDMKFTIVIGQIYIYMILYIYDILCIYMCDILCVYIYIYTLYMIYYIYMLNK